MIDASARRELDQHQLIEHESLPGFELAVKELFELPKPKR
jgi:hypothetical protein